MEGVPYQHTSSQGVASCKQWHCWPCHLTHSSYNVSQVTCLEVAAEWESDEAMLVVPVVLLLLPLPPRMSSELTSRSHHSHAHSLQHIAGHGVVHHGQAIGCTCKGKGSMPVSNRAAGEGGE